MSVYSAQEIQHAIDLVYRSESRRVFATLVRLLRDFDLAEEALHEAFAQAVTCWTETGVPENSRAWLVSTGRFKAIDALRRRGRSNELSPEIARCIDEISQFNAARADHDMMVCSCSFYISIHRWVRSILLLSL